MNQIGIWIVLAIIATGLAASGCTAPSEPLVVTNPDPSVKIPAIKIAAANHDHNAAKQLVEDLESDDPAIRFYAIDGLRRITGEDFGYVFYEDESQRKPAVARWQGWLKESRGEPVPAPATQSSTQP